METPLRIGIAAGGTGGHLFPALAILEAIEKRRAVHPLFFGIPSKIETKILPQRGFPLILLPMKTSRRVLSLETAQIPFAFLRSFFRVLQAFRQFQPQCVLCTGAYLSIPVGMAASIAKIPLFLLESNRLPGKANRWLAPMAQRIYAAFEDTLNFLPKSVRSRVIFSGNPIRPTLVENIPSQHVAKKTLGFDPHAPLFLVLGGSLGAASINRAIAHLIPRFIEQQIQLLWQTGQSRLPELDSLPPFIQVVPFIHDMQTAYAAADVILSRAGASAIAEIAAFGKAAIFVPYPYATDNHQYHNASILQQANAAIVLADNTLLQQLESTVLFLLSHPDQREALGTRIRKFAQPKAAEIIADDILASLNRM